MRKNLMVDPLARRSPTIVAITWSAALAAYWLSAPLWLPYGIAILVGVLALVVVARRRRLAQADHEAESGSTSSAGWIAHELAGNGSPPGFYVLLFFGFVTIMLTGVEGAYATPAWAGLALGAAWGIANARYPKDEAAEL